VESPTVKRRDGVVRDDYDRRVAELSTERLVLRQWRDSDLELFAELNADPEVMRHFPAPMARGESDSFAQMVSETIERQGWGLWAVGVTAGPDYIGFVGLNTARFEAPFTPAVEVGWRLAREHWGHGYATEAARAAIAFGFDELNLDEIVSFSAPANERSRRVMERLGMTHDPRDDFDHPRVPARLNPHVLYRRRSGRLPADRDRP
jgi:RimJ/RimL family protein N-acetyltransferase